MKNIKTAFRVFLILFKLLINLLPIVAKITNKIPNIINKTFDWSVISDINNKPLVFK